MSNIVIKFFTVLVKLCFLEGKVSDLPYSETLFWGLLILMNALMIGIYTINQAGEIIQIALGVIAHFVILLGGLLALLSFKKMRNRFNQLTSAFIGTQLVFFVFMSLGQHLVPSQMFGFFILFFGIWELVVQANILKQTLEINMLQAVGLLLGLAILSALPLLSFAQLKPTP